MSNLRLKEKVEALFSNKLFLYSFVTCASLLIIFSRRPDAFLNPQFFVEDGPVWYAQAYELGFSSLLIPVSYYHTVERLVALFSLLFPLAFAPAIFNFSAIGIKLVVVNFLVSARLSKVLPGLPTKLLFGFLYLAIPNSSEVNANLTNFHWHSGLLMFLVIIAEPGKRAGWKIFDTLSFLIFSLSGPFCIFLVPVAFVRWYYSREKWILWLLCILSAGALIQGYGMTHGDRPQAATLGASPGLFAKIIGVQVFLSSILGIHGYGWLNNRHLWGVVSLAVVNLIGFFLLGYAAVKSKFELKLFILFAALIFTAALASPVSEPDKLAWNELSMPHTGVRYWFIPLLCFAVTTIYLSVRAEPRIVKNLAKILVVLMPIGIFLDCKYGRFTDYEFQKYAREFETAAPGTEKVIPINPGGNWKLRLIKR